MVPIRRWSAQCFHALQPEFFDNHLRVSDAHVYPLPLSVEHFDTVLAHFVISYEVCSLSRVPLLDMPFSQCKSSMSAVEMKSSSVNEHDDVTLVYRNTPVFPRATKNPQLHCKSAKHLCKFLAADLLPFIGPEKLPAHQFVFGPSVFLAKLPEQCRCAGRMEICLCVLV